MTIQAPYTSLSGEDSDFVPQLDDLWTWPAAKREQWAEVDGDMKCLNQAWRLPFRAIAANELSHAAETLGCGPGYVLRDVYMELTSRIVAHNSLSPDDGVVVFGQRGCGKSVYIFHLLRVLLSIGQPVLLALPSGTHLFFGDGVYTMPTPVDLEALPQPIDGPRALWTLLDVPRAEQPPFNLEKRALFPVCVASSPFGSEGHWTSARGGLRVGMPLWSVDELSTRFLMDARRTNFVYHLWTDLHTLAPSGHYDRAILQWQSRNNLWTHCTLAAGIDDIVKDSVAKYGNVPGTFLNETYAPQTSVDALAVSRAALPIALQYPILLSTLSGTWNRRTKAVFVVQTHRDEHDRTRDVATVDFRSARIAQEARSSVVYWNAPGDGLSFTDTQARTLFRACSKGQETSFLADMLFASVARWALASAGPEADVASHELFWMRRAAGHAYAPEDAMLRVQSVDDIPIAVNFTRRAVAHFSVGATPATLDERTLYLTRPVVPLRDPAFDALFLELDEERQLATVWVFKTTFAASCANVQGHAGELPIDRLVDAAEARFIAKLHEDNPGAPIDEERWDCLRVSVNLVLVHPEIRTRRRWEWAVPMQWIKACAKRHVELHAFDMPLRV
ncbi:hypothetical protein C8Q80DRAFT_291193 [Daedaleopsis nitida]|nr:hypothetical protein C8Q80DRAFT_291193 [Daedaleopsis nitida]